MADYKYLPVFASLMKEAGILVLFGFLRLFASKKHSASYNLNFYSTVTIFYSWFYSSHTLVYLQPISADDLLTQLSTALHMLTTSPSSSEIMLDDLLIRYEEVLNTANCGLLEPTILSEDRQSIADDINVIKVSKRDNS